MKRLAIFDENGIVVNIIVANDDFFVDGAIEYTDDNPARVGGDYVDGYFYPPKPYPSWTRDKGHWVPPIPAPVGTATFLWDEEQQAWIAIQTL